MTRIGAMLLTFVLGIIIVPIIWVFLALVFISILLSLGIGGLVGVVVLPFVIWFVED